DGVLDARHVPDPAIQAEPRLGRPQGEHDEDDRKQEELARLRAGDDAPAVVQLLEGFQHHPEDRNLDRETRSVANQGAGSAGQPGGHRVRVSQIGPPGRPALAYAAAAAAGCSAARRRWCTPSLKATM